jgi:ABC-type Fe3+ transport system substrate-binding protein
MERFSIKSHVFALIVGCAAAGGALAQGAAWDQLVEAAKKEGELTVVTPPGQSFRDGIVSGFTKAYPTIRLSVSAQHIRDVLPKILRERDAGVYSTDAMVGGVGGGVFQEWIPKGVLVPLKAQLIRADVTDDSKWFCGLDWGWMDKGKAYVLGFVTGATSQISVNRDAISEAEFPAVASFNELMNPKWKGKISWQDPRELGGGQNVSALILRSHGEQFLRRLITEQKPVFTRDNRQQVEWLVRNRYPIGLAADDTILGDFKKDGLGRRVETVQFKESNILIPGFSVLSVFDKAPHPNAAKLFANWLLTREGQDAYTSATRQNSRRLDVPPYAGVPAPSGSACKTAIDMQKEEYAALRGQSGKVAAGAYEEAR